MLGTLAAEDFHCAPCALSYAELGVPEAVRIIGEVPVNARAALEATPAPVLRRRPEPGIWCALEYACHLRDVYVTSTIRLYRTRTEDRPVLEPMLNDLRAARFQYAGTIPEAVLGELEAAVDGCLAEIERVRDWDRTASRLPGEVRGTRWLVRQAAHEGVHHVRDIREVSRSAPEPPRPA